MQLSQLPLVQIVKFQCLSNREFPEFFKTHPTYISRSILKGSRSLQTKPAIFIFRVCIYMMLHKKLGSCLRGINQAGSIFRSSECYSETGDRGTERQGLVYSAQWRNPYNLGTKLGSQSAVHSVLKHKTRANCKLSVSFHKRDKGICLWWDKTNYWGLSSWVI